MAMMNEMEYRTIGSALAGGYRAAVYCRLSKDDDLQGESASIANQRDMLEKYCEKQGWEVVAVYQDDGFTGLNMERPDLQRMLRAIERRQVNLVITKDLSRLGRNYLQTGHLIEDFFPRNGVRYIAMNDGIDTLRDNNDIAPFKNILNEMYSKDISKKVHSSYLLKAQKGQFTGCLAPFGYRKDPEDKNHLLIDEETAPIVRLIFGYALNGHGPNYIRRRLEEEKIPCPTWWNRERGLRNTRTKWEKKDPENGRYMWDFSVIKDLLMNPVYTGAIASQKKDYRFKIGTIGEKKPEDWIVVEGQHEPLIDRMSFDIVQNKLKSRQRPGQTNEISLFAGLLKCGECGKSLTVRYTNAKHPQRIYSCKTYNAFGKNHCTQHRIDYDTLYSHVLRKIRECARAALMDGEITSTVDGSEIPTKDNQSNFGTGFEYQYGADNTIEIFMNEKWIVFEQREGDGSKVRYGDRMVDAEDLSKETLEWLDWYNSLPEEQQLAVSFVPSDLIEETGPVKTEDAEVPAQEEELCGYPLAPEEVE